MDIPLDEVIYFDAISSSSTGAAADADSTPTFAVYEEATDTDIGVGGNMTKRTSLTGNYRGSFTASAANGFELGKWYNVIGSATIGAVACKGVLMRFRIVAAEANAGYPRADVSHFGGTAGTFSSGRPEVNTTHWGGTAVASANVLIDGAITAAKLASDAITAAKIASGAITAAKFGSGAIDATVLATDAIGSAQLAASAITEIQSGLATSSALTLVASDVTAIKAKTDNLPVDPADASDILGYYNSLSSALTTIIGYLDTEVAAILAKTNNLPSDPADQSLVEAAITSAQSALTSLINTVDTVVDAIKVKTDQLGFTNANKVDAAVLSTNDFATAVAQKLAHIMLRRTMAAVESASDGDTLNLSSLYGLVQFLQEASLSGSALTIKQTDGSTTLGTKTVTTDANADPITSVS